MQRSEFVDFLKGYSIFAIILFHLIAFYLDVPTIVKTASNFGGAGVHIFIACSGFGLSLSYIRKKESYLKFTRKRFFKIYIPYIIIVFLSFLLPYMYNRTDKTSALFSHIFLYKMFIEKYIDSFGIQFWFMSTIIQFYIIFYLLIKIKELIGEKKFIIVSSLISFIYAITICLLRVNNLRIYSNFFLQYLWEFSFGIILAYKFNNNKINIKINDNIILFVTISSFIIYCMMSLKGGWLKNFNDPFSLLSFGGIAYFIYKIKPMNTLFKKMNSFSYELYLIHILVYNSVFYLLKNILSNVLLCILAFAISIIFAYTYKKIIDRSFRMVK